MGKEAKNFRMNAEQIIASAVESELGKHTLWASARKCSCMQWSFSWNASRHKQIVVAHNEHVAEMIAQTLLGGAMPRKEVIGAKRKEASGAAESAPA